MAHLWINGQDGWGARKLSGAVADLTGAEGGLVPEPTSAGRAAPQLILAEAGGTKVWALIVSANSCVRVNGRTPAGGLCALTDRDEIRIGKDAMYFSTETLAAIEGFPGAGRPVSCGRCRQVIEVGSPSICCSGCNIWYHQDSDLPCYTYAKTCTFCGCSSALDSGFTWVPEED